MFTALVLSNEPTYQPVGFWHAFKDYDGQSVNLREHQDAYEFFTRLQVWVYTCVAYYVWVCCVIPGCVL